MTIAIIVARGGSKRLPRKNVYPVCGLPLVAWSIIQAQCSNAIDEVYVSTDDDEIAGIAEEFKAQVIRRPDWPDADEVSASRPMLHALQEIAPDPDDMMYAILPSTPTRKPKDFDSMMVKWMEIDIPDIYMSLAIHLRHVYYAKQIGPALIQPVTLDKSGKFWAPMGGATLSTVRKYLTEFVFGGTERPASDLDADIDNDSQYKHMPIYFSEIEPWQDADIHVESDVEYTELMMEHYILQGRGSAIYFDYAGDLRQYIGNWRQT